MALKKKRYSEKGNIKLALKNNVYLEAKERVKFIFDEFDQVMIAVSGGKDSTVVLELALAEARERGRLPLKAMFIDQEAEWVATIDMIEDIMNRDDIEPVWMQIPFKIFNATSFHDHWLWTWDEKKQDKWIRPKSPLSKKENIYGTIRFMELFNKIVEHEFGGKKGALIGGLRGEESPIRAKALTRTEIYKGRTWGKFLNQKLEQYTFYPVYDWSYIDVWKAIHDNNWTYCKIYDYMYQHGVGIRDMRVSNLHHETAVRSLFILQEIEPDNYNKIVQRIDGIHMASKLRQSMFCPKDLPYMFSSWAVYREYLIDNLLQKEWHEKFKKFFAAQDILYGKFIEEKRLCKLHIQSILTNDHEFLKIRNPQIPKERYAEFKIHRKQLAAERQAVKDAAKLCNK